MSGRYTMHACMQTCAAFSGHAQSQLMPCAIVPAGLTLWLHRLHPEVPSSSLSMPACICPGLLCARWRRLATIAVRLVQVVEHLRLHMFALLIGSTGPHEAAREEDLLHCLNRHLVPAWDTARGGASMLHMSCLPFEHVGKSAIARHALACVWGDHELHHR